MNLQELIAAMKDRVAQMNALVESNPEGMDDETAAKFDALDQEVGKLQASIERAKKVGERQASMEDGVGRQVAAAKVPAKAKDHNAEAFGGYANIGEFANDVRNACTNNGVDDRLRVLGAPANPHRETSSTDGFVVPSAMSTRIFSLMFEDAGLLGMVDVEPTNSNSVSMIADESTPWGSTGIQAYWGVEAGQLQKSRLETSGKEVKLHKLHAFVEATDELLEDAPRLSARLEAGSSRALRWKANEAIHTGNGVGKPLGFRSAGSKVIVAKESSQTAATVNITNIAKMFSRSINPGGSVWVVNQDVLPQIMLLKYDDGSPAWTAPSQGFAQAPGGFLLGRPVMFSDHCETLGAEGDVMFVDPKGYYMPQRQSSAKFSSSLHLYFDYDTAAFKWTFRLGGQPYLKNAVTPNKGSATRSHCVLLALRA